MQKDRSIRGKDSEDNEKEKVVLPKVIYGTVADFGPNVIDLHLKGK